LKPRPSDKPTGAVPHDGPARRRASCPPPPNHRLRWQAAGRRGLTGGKDMPRVGAHTGAHDPAPRRLGWRTRRATPGSRSMSGGRHPLAAAMGLVLAAGGVHAEEAWKTSGDVRFGYVASETRARSGAESDADSLRARLRLRLRGDLGGGWHVSGRVAARLDSDQDDEAFWMRTYAPGPAGLEDGQATIDEAYLEYRPAQSPWSFRVGRFQAAWGLDDVMKKSLDQNDSPNFDVTWTDGAWLQWRASDDWTTHLVLRHNDRRGPTGTLRRDRKS